MKRTATGGPVRSPSVNVLPPAAVTRSVPRWTNLLKKNGSKRSIRRLHRRSSSCLREARAPAVPQAQAGGKSAVSGGGCSERGDYNKVPPAPQSGHAPPSRGNRLTFAPLWAKGRNPGRRLVAAGRGWTATPGEECL